MKTLKQRSEKPFIWSDLRPYFRRITFKDTEFVESSKWKYLYKQENIDSLENCIKELKTEIKVDKTELSAELKDMVKNPDKYHGTPMNHNVLLQPNEGESSNYSYLLKFSE